MIKERQKNPNSFISNRFLLFFNTFYAHLKQNSCMTFYVHVIVDFIEYNKLCIVMLIPYWQRQRKTLDSFERNMQELHDKMFLKSQKTEL